MHFTKLVLNGVLLRKVSACSSALWVGLCTSAFIENRSLGVINYHNNPILDTSRYEIGTLEQAIAFYCWFNCKN